MEAREKAKELVAIYDNIPMEDGFIISLVQAKTCALIAVDEINNALQNIPDLQVSGNVLLDQIKYYQEVKKEITNLK